MKILYVLHSFPPFHWRGTEVYGLELSAAMREKGEEAQVFYLCSDPQTRDLTLEADLFQGIPVHRLRVKLNPAEPASYFFHSGQEEHFRELLKRFRPEVVHFLYYAAGLSLGLAEQAWQAGAKIVITVTDFSGPCPRGQLLDRQGNSCAGPREGLNCQLCLFDQPLWPGHSRLDRFLRRYLPPALISERRRPELDLLRRRLAAVRQAFSRATLVIYPCTHTRKRYHQCGIRGGREEIMDYGIDLTPFLHHRKTPASHPRIAFLGQILPHKGLLVLAQAIYSLPPAGMLICYGSLEDPGVSDYLAQFGIYLERIDFRGTFPFSEMNRVLEGIDILVVPSQWEENCPLIVKYALATGTWAVLADQPGIVSSRPGLERVRFFAPADYLALRRVLVEVMAEVEKERQQTLGPTTVKKLPPAVVDIREQSEILIRLYQ